MNLNKYLELPKLMRSPNLIDEMDADDVARIGGRVFDDFQMDKEDRSAWDDKVADALDLALQIAEDKTFPWPQASNIKFPIVTVAALQYHARAYPALVQGAKIVKARVIGGTNAEKEQVAARIAEHMSYQLLEEDEGWEEDHDRALLIQPIVGCVFKKTYYDPSKGHNVSRVIHPKNLYVPYFSRSLEDAPRVTERIMMSRNSIQEKVVRGLFVEDALKAPVGFLPYGVLEAQQQQSQSTHPNSADPSLPIPILEQHCWFDLDGDGYNEPYIVTIREDTHKPLRIVARFDSSGVKRSKGRIFHIEGDQYYTKYPFIPSPDGGFYDVGFGTLLGPLNESINTIVNQIVDAGTLSNTAGGFIGRGAKLRKGKRHSRHLSGSPLTPQEMIFANLSLRFRFVSRLRCCLNC